MPTVGCIKPTMSSPLTCTHGAGGRTITAKKTNTRHPKNNNYRKIAEAHVVPKIGAPSFTPLGDKSNVVTTTPSSETKIENPPSPQLDAKATIAAKMGDPNSAEFENWERAARKNALGNSIDVMCG